MKKESGIRLNKKVYPLYVGASRNDNFQNWDGKGSSVLLEAEVASEGYGKSDIAW